MNEVARQQDALPATATLTPMEMLSRALEKGVDTEQLSKFMDLYDRWEADQARKAYVQAMAEFKTEPLKVEKSKHVRYQTSKGITEYDHADLADIVDAVVIAMSKCGLSHKWETSQDANTITVSCVITHHLGHSERTTLSAGPDDSGGKNSIQAVGSTVTYLQRYTLMAATGLAAHGMDDDGQGAGQPAKKITGSQLADLEAKIEEAGANKAAFLKVLNVEKLADLPVSKLKGAVDRLETKRRQAND